MSAFSPAFSNAFDTFNAIAPAGIASAEAFGTAALTQTTRCSGIASAEAFGTAAVVTGPGPVNVQFDLPARRSIEFSPECKRSIEFAMNCRRSISL